MAPQGIVSPDDQNVTFVELFFDLVFVFSVTQVVGLLHDDLSWRAIGEAVLVFWLVWWAWTQFTWALNAANTTHHLVELAALGATAVAFFMAVAVPDTFRGNPLGFAIPYVLVRAIGLVLYGWVAENNPAQHAAVRRFSIVSLSGLAAVLVGAVVGGAAQYWIWGVAILLDVVAALVGGRSEHWNLHPEHFGERHGLFVIIALGETLIVAAGGVTGADITPALLLESVLAVAITCALWWSYFTTMKPRLDHALETSRGAARSILGRDAFSLLHFPIVCGVIIYAAVMEHAVSHPAEPLPLDFRFALAAGVTLFVGGTALAIWRALGLLLAFRLLAITATAAAIILIGGVAPYVTLGVAFVGVAVVAGVEQRSSPIGPHAPRHPAGDPHHAPHLAGSS